jgi:hypothetical protein
MHLSNKEPGDENTIMDMARHRGAAGSVFGSCDRAIRAIGNAACRV